jgi:hypothetical protein
VYSKVTDVMEQEYAFDTGTIRGLRFPRREYSALDSVEVCTVAEIILRLSSLTLYALIWLFLAFTDYLDWYGRMEVLEEKHPQVAKLVNSRPLRLVLLLMLLGILIDEFRETIKQVESEPFVIKMSVPAPAAPSITIHKVMIKTTGSGRLDRDMNTQQSTHLFDQLKKIADNPDTRGLAKITIVHPYPQDRESQHLFMRLNKVFGDAHWKVSPYQGWPPPELQGIAPNKIPHAIPIGIWFVTDNDWLRYEIWSDLQQGGLDSEEHLRFDMPSTFKGFILIVGYKDSPF